MSGSNLSIYMLRAKQDLLVITLIRMILTWYSAPLKLNTPCRVEGLRLVAWCLDSVFHKWIEHHSIFNPVAWLPIYGKCCKNLNKWSHQGLSGPVVYAEGILLGFSNSKVIKAVYLAVETWKLKLFLPSLYVTNECPVVWWGQHGMRPPVVQNMHKTGVQVKPRVNML